MLITSYEILKQYTNQPGLETQTKNNPF